MRTRMIATILATGALAACNEKVNGRERFHGVDAHRSTGGRTEVDVKPVRIPGVDAASDSVAVGPDEKTTADTAPHDTPR